MDIINVYAARRYTRLPKETIFVFGSNLAGRHGAGGAKDALDYFGAIYGQASGLQGNSYGIPTKDKSFQVLSLNNISKYTSEFIEHARLYPNRTYLITPFGTGLSRLSASDIASLFTTLPSNCIFPHTWVKFFPNSAALMYNF
jgi:hypothetical protein